LFKIVFYNILLHNYFNSYAIEVKVLIYCAWNVEIFISCALDVYVLISCALDVEVFISIAFRCVSVNFLINLIAVLNYKVCLCEP